MFPTPAAFPEATDKVDHVTEDLLAMSLSDRQISKPLPGTLPELTEVSSAARGLLMRLLERDPKVRLRSLRQLQQTAFYMGYNIDKVKTKQCDSPISIIEHLKPLKSSDLQSHGEQIDVFKKFDQQGYVL